MVSIETAVERIRRMEKAKRRKMIENAITVGLATLAAILFTIYAAIK